MARESPVAQRPPRVPYFLRWTAGSRTKHKTVALSLQLPIHRHHEGVISSSTAAGDPLPSALCSLPWQALERCAAPIPPQLPHLSRLTPRPVAQWPEQGAYLLMSQTGAQGGPPGKNRYLLTARRPSALTDSKQGAHVDAVLALAPVRVVDMSVMDISWLSMYGVGPGYTGP